MTKGFDITVISPNDGFFSSDMEKGCAYLKTKGYHVKFPSILEDYQLSQEFQGDREFTPNDSPFMYEYRLKQVRDAIHDDSGILWAWRGGFGLSQLMKDLYKEKPQKKKIFIGFSDMSQWHQWMTKEWGWTAIHGPVLKLSIPPYEDFWLESFDETFKLLNHLRNPQKSQQYQKSMALYPLSWHGDHRFFYKKEYQGHLWGGNLCVLSYTLGTPWAVDFTDTIVFLEDLNEPAYRIQEYLNHLMNSGALKKAKAIILGDFRPHPDSLHLHHRMWCQWSQFHGIPVFQGLPVGHYRWCLPLIQGCQVRLFPDPHPHSYSHHQLHPLPLPLPHFHPLHGDLFFLEGLHHHPKDRWVLDFL